MIKLWKKYVIPECFNRGSIIRIKRCGTIFLLIAFIVTSCGLSELAQAQTVIYLPAPGVMVSVSLPFHPLQLKGLQVHAQNPLQFDFLVDKGQSHLTGKELKDEVSRLAKYFLTCLTVPESDLWVNLSPYEKDRIAPEAFGVTQMGKDLLEQDYLLKQIMASLSYPERELGKYFWQKIYEKAYALYGTTRIPVHTFNKVWIVPKSAEVYARGNSAFVTHSELDVMLETDYLAVRNNLNNTALGLYRVKNQDDLQYSKLYSQIMREVILPTLRKEVNEGRNFALVRQVYDAMILATWYKRHLKDSLLGRMYVGKNKVNGVDVQDKNVKEKIFRQYLIAYKKRVYNYIKEDYDPMTAKTEPRHYVSGGMDFEIMGVIGNHVYREVPFAPNPSAFLSGNFAMASISVAMSSNGNPINFPTRRSPISKRIHAILPKLVMMAGFSLLTFLPAQTLKAAVITPQNDGTVKVEIKKGDTLGEIAPAVYQAYRQINPDGRQSDVHKPVWGNDGLVQTLFGGKIDNLDRIYPGNTVFIGSPTVSKSVQKFTDTVVKSVSGPAVGSAIAPEPEKVSAADIYQSILSASHEQTTQVAGGSPDPPDPEGFFSAEKIGLAFATLFGIAGLYIKGYTFSGLTRKAKAGPAPVPPPSSGASFPPVSLPPLNGSVLIDTALPPPPARPGETQILAEDLNKLRAVANGEIAPPPPIPAEDQTTGPGRKYLRWMVPGALLGGLGFSLYLGGFHAAQERLHEIFNFVPATVLLDCGIIGFVKRIPSGGIRKKDITPWLTWFFDSMDSLTVRGGQQAGVTTDITGADGDFVHMEEKITKQKRNWFFWQTWDKGPVFYRNMVNDLHARLYKTLPDKLCVLYNYTKSGVLKFLGHVRFATGGAMVPQAAHPFSSPKEKREVWVFDAVQNTFKKVIRIFQVTSAFNGDHDNSKIGIPYRKLLNERSLEFPQMRRFYSAAVHSYYEGRVTKSYLKKTVSDGRQENQEVPTNYTAVLWALRKKGHINFFFRVCKPQIYRA